MSRASRLALFKTLRVLRPGDQIVLCGRVAHGNGTARIGDIGRVVKLHPRAGGKKGGIPAAVTARFNDCTLYLAPGDFRWAVYRFTPPKPANILKFAVPFALAVAVQIILILFAFLLYRRRDRSAPSPSSAVDPQLTALTASILNPPPPPERPTCAVVAPPPASQEGGVAGVAGQSTLLAKGAAIASDLTGKGEVLLGDVASKGGVLIGEVASKGSVLIGEVASKGGVILSDAVAKGAVIVNEAASQAPQVVSGLLGRGTALVTEVVEKGGALAETGAAVLAESVEKVAVILTGAAAGTDTPASGATVRGGDDAPACLLPARGLPPPSSAAVPPPAAEPPAAAPASAEGGEGGRWKYAMMGLVYTGVAAGAIAAARNTYSRG